MRVELEQQVIDFVRDLAPVPRRALRRGLRKLQGEEGEIRALEGELEGFFRLRLARCRVIFFYKGIGRARVIRCVHAGPRELVYERFAQELLKLLLP